MIAHGLGFAYYSNMPCIVFLCTIAIYWLIKSKIVERIFLIVSIPVHILVYKISTVRLVFYLYILFLVFAFIFIVTFMFEKFRALSAFNAAINFRLSFNLQGFQKYGIRLLGQKIVTEAEHIDFNFINHYFYIDCGYVYMLIGYGIILFIIIMMIYILLSRYAVAK